MYLPTGIDPMESNGVKKLSTIRAADYWYSKRT